MDGFTACQRALPCRCNRIRGGYLKNTLTLVDGFEPILAQRLLFHPLLAGIAGLGAITLFFDADGIQPAARATNGFAAQYVSQGHPQKNQ